jgi:hypothetical protein
MIEKPRVPARVRIARLLIRTAVILAVCGIIILIPDSAIGDVMPYKNSICTVIMIGALGKLIYDSLFYDRMPM